MDYLNETIDPSCLHEPPLALDVIHQLDMFGVALYSILTFMASVSLLLYLEECVYIYKNVPSPKKTTIIWVNGAAPVIATMSCLGMWIPRATMFTDMTSNSYFAVVIYKVLILMLEECGGDEAFLRYSESQMFRINTGPCCCCCLCLPRVPVTRYNLFIVFELTEPGSVLEITGAAIWINPFIGVLTLISLWPVAIMFMNIRNTLRRVKIIPKYAMYQLVLILSQLQSAIISILALDGTIACAPPFSSIARGSMFSQQLMIIEMFIVTLVTHKLYRRTYDLITLDPHENDNELNKMVKLHTASLEEHVA
ncbi:hypothetical protein P4O66_016514 [Electrophorus voltai]|uniref:Organic solute transporter subunit alpha n=1 Tax=Electrophorus voltai TaxID=2609070 RepID=A0AAD9DNB1_9TELE|nr:hypothetical protein P4O66_016514 [Electrophorus voltai]